jgi:hypothetical protein
MISAEYNTMPFHTVTFWYEAAKLHRKSGPVPNTHGVPARTEIMAPSLQYGAETFTPRAFARVSDAETAGVSNVMLSPMASAFAAAYLCIGLPPCMGLWGRSPCGLQNAPPSHPDLTAFDLVTYTPARLPPSALHALVKFPGAKSPAVSVITVNDGFGPDCDRVW